MVVVVAVVVVVVVGVVVADDSSHQVDTDLECKLRAPRSSRLP